MFCRQHSHWIIQLAAVAAILLSGHNAFAVDGPSFDCSQGVRQTLAVILCIDPEAAQADWDVNRAYWALFTDDREELKFNQTVIQRCALPRLETAQERAGRIVIQELGRRFGPGLPIPTAQPVTQQHVRCVISAFHNRAAALRGRLKGDALVESNLSPEEHKEIQSALLQKGFLQNRGHGTNADGQFGPNTRSAIKDFQRSFRAQATGFLSNEQRLALAESSEERDAREARANEAERSRREAVEAQRRDEQLENEREKKRLEDEAAKAVEWRRKIDEAQKKGTEYAAKLADDVEWSLQESDNPMNDDQEYTVSSSQPNKTGALAVVKGVCSKDQVLFRATLQDANDPKIPLGFGSSRAGGIIGNKRINDNSSFATNFPLDNWNNRIVVSRQSFRQDDPESADTTWRVLAEIETSRGTLIIKIPTLDAKIQKLIASCKYRYEVEKRRRGSPDTPG